MGGLLDIPSSFIRGVRIRETVRVRSMGQIQRPKQKRLTISESGAPFQREYLWRSSLDNPYPILSLG